MTARAPRVDATLSRLGYASRREAQRLCDSGRLTLQGEPVRDASLRLEPALLALDGEPLEHPDGLLVVLHKPLGFVCSHQERDGRLVYELLPERWRRREPPVTSVGRLDKDTSGVLLLTDLGPLVHQLTSPRHEVEKVYRARLDRPVDPETVEAFARGVTLRGESRPTLPARLEPLEGREARVTLREGRYHQVRRMFAARGLQVEALHRESFGPHGLEGLAPGEWRVVVNVPPTS